MRDYLYNKYFDARLIMRFDTSDVFRELLLENVTYANHERKAVVRFTKSILGKKNLNQNDAVLNFEQFVHIIERFV